MRYPAYLRGIHLALASLCLLAWGSAQFAGDYKRAVHLGFTIHEIVGIGFTVALALRVLVGLLGPQRARFSTWFPFGPDNLRLVLDDLRNAARLRVAQRAPHEGIAGIVQFLGLLAFVLIASTGTLLAFYLEPGARASGWVHGLKEVHEAAQVLIPVYLGLHVGGTLVHALLGDPLWREMFFFGKSR
jgi:cytochrome b